MREVKEKDLGKDKKGRRISQEISKEGDKLKTKS